MSSHSNGGEATCVEVGGDRQGVTLVRDSTDRAGATLSITPAAWTAFLDAIR
ncbi:MAG TPA: DUF397 domain-containing protein [Trebonia sp.]|nr:DUF397 domain-containing protein [Trebonia sp.]